MQGSLSTKGAPYSLFVDLNIEDFSGIPEFQSYRNEILQRKDEFHITLFRSPENDFIVPPEVRQGISDILSSYQGSRVGKIKLSQEGIHLRKGEKYSLIKMVESEELGTILSEIHRKFLSIGVGEVDFPPLHITLYTDLFHPRGIGVRTYEDLLTLV